MWQHGMVAGTLVAAVFVGPANAQTTVLFGFVEGDSEFAVRRAAQGAAARLAQPACQDLFAEFTDANGRRLSAILESKGTRPVDAFRTLRFFDTSAAPQCHAGTTLAFTEPGSPVIRVCALPFKNRFMKDRRFAEIILIHEFLHALGLGENPPTSREITQRVESRCGD